MKLLALDYGLQRVGIAISPAASSMAFARCALSRAVKERFWADFLALLAEERPQALVLGLPLHKDGSESETARQVLNFARSLKRRVKLPIYLMPEELSSQAAESLLRERGRINRENKGKVDALAAALILESFLALPEEKRAEKRMSDD